MTESFMSPHCSTFSTNLQLSRDNSRAVGLAAVVYCINTVPNFRPLFSNLKSIYNLCDWSTHLRTEEPSYIIIYNNNISPVFCSDGILNVVRTHNGPTHTLYPLIVRRIEAHLRTFGCSKETCPGGAAGRSRPPEVYPPIVSEIRINTTRHVCASVYIGRATRVVVSTSGVYIDPAWRPIISCINIEPPPSSFRWQRWLKPKQR
jgi:hypothetical protein